MAPAAKKSKTAAASPAAGNGSLSKLFGAKSAPKTDSDEKPNVAAPTVSPLKQLFGKAPEAATPPAEAAPAPAETKTPARTEPKAAEPQAATPAAPGLSDDQRKRIEDNRRLAMERQAAKKRALEEGQTTTGAPPVAQSAPASPPAPAAARAAEAPKAGFPWPKGKAQAKGAAAGKAKAKAKADGLVKSGGLFGKQSSPQASPTKDSLPQSSPAKNPDVNPNVAAATPEKTPPPAPEKESPPKTPAVPRAPHVPSSRFETVKCQDWNQYFGLYGARLKQLRGRVQEEARSMWGGMIAAEGFRADISGFKSSGCQEVVLFGVLFKDMKGRPNVIEEYQKYKICKAPEDLDAEAAALSPGAYCTDEDALYLEDKSMRLQLEVSREQLEQFPTGLVVGVRGVPTPEGTLKASAFIFSRLPPPPVLPTPASEGAEYLVLVSGIAPGEPSSEEGSQPSLVESHKRLVDFLSKGLEGAKMKRVIVCGGALCSKKIVSRNDKISKKALAASDELLTQMSNTVPLDLMPGRSDPTNLNLPQQPLHPHLFKRARACPEGAFRCVSNPHAGAIEGCSILGHSGLPVDDFLRCTKGTTPMGTLQMCLESMHMAPTAPDTLPMPPVSDGEDPFIIQEVPHIFFSGGHARAEHLWLPAPRGETPTCGTQLICVPAWETQPAAVLVNLRDPRDVRVQHFGDAA